MVWAIVGGGTGRGGVLGWGLLGVVAGGEGGLAFGGPIEFLLRFWEGMGGVRKLELCEREGGLWLLGGCDDGMHDRVCGEAIDEGRVGRDKHYDVQHLR